MHYDFWPSVPFIHHSVPNEYFADMVVRKELEIQNEKCEETEYDYYGNSISRINSWSTWKTIVKNIFIKIDLFVSNFQIAYVTVLETRSTTKTLVAPYHGF